MRNHTKLTLATIGATGLLALPWAGLEAQDTTAEEAERPAAEESARAAAQAASQNLEVDAAVLTSGVVDRLPADSLTTVPADVGEVYLWTRIAGAEGETEVEHVWYRDGEEAARVPLRVASPMWRTWSTKNILPSWTGSWSVEVVGPDGAVLETLSFTVEEAAREGTPAEPAAAEADTATGG